MAQYKAHLTQHEYSLSTAVQKAVYFLAVFFNTLSYSLLLNCVFSICMFFCSHMYFVAPRGSAKQVLGFFVVGFICVGFKACLTLDVTYVNGLIYGKAFQRVPRTDVIRKNDRLARIFNSAEVLQLPTSTTHDMTYNSVHSVNLMVRMSRQCVAYTMLLGWCSVLLPVNLVVVQFDIALSYEFQYLLILGAIVVPLGWLASYLLLYAYFRLDKGYLSRVDMLYVYCDEPPPASQDFVLRENCDGPDDEEDGRLVDELSVETTAEIVGRMQDYVDRLGANDHGKEVNSCRLKDCRCPFDCWRRPRGELSTAGYWVDCSHSISDG